MKSINFRLTSNVRRNEGLSLYMSEMNRYKVNIDDTEMRALIERAQNGEVDARNKAIEANLRIVWSIAKAYNGMDVFEDILQNGNYGLCVAVDTFDLTRENKFSTWALEMVRKHISIGLTNESRVVRQGAHFVKQKATYHAASMDAPLASDDEGDKTLLDTFSSEITADNLTDKADMDLLIQSKLAVLTPTERKVVLGLFIGDETKYTLSRQLGCTEERVRQICRDALKKCASAK